MTVSLLGLTRINRQCEICVDRLADYNVMSLISKPFGPCMLI